MGVDHRIITGYGYLVDVPRDNYIDWYEISETLSEINENLCVEMGGSEGNYYGLFVGYKLCEQLPLYGGLECIDNNLTAHSQKRIKKKYL